MTTPKFPEDPAIPAFIPLTDSAGYLECGCHGSQKDHTCTLAEDYDDDGDDEEPVDGESFDGGYGYDSYFHRAMKKDD